MKKITFVKTFVLSCFMAAVMALPMTSYAQNDDFFRAEEFNGGIRTVDAWVITNNGIGQSEAPVGSGLLILGAAGAGYFIAKRRKNKKGAALLIVLALMFGFTQCKKNVETISEVASNGVYITLRVDGGEKVGVNPTGGDDYATVTWENGDIIYVGNNGAYCGYLTYDGTNFGGTITPTSGVDEDYLHFYFMGNKGPKDNPTSAVSISDQRDSYPVISYGRSTTLYNAGTTSYSTTLFNKCAIVKFTTTNIDADITITGMNNTVGVDFSKNKGAGDPINPYTYTKTGDGNITIHKESNTVRWAILLPQDEVTTATASATGYETESPFTVPAITTNMYSNTGVAVTLAQVWDGDLAKLTNSSTEAFATARDGMTIYGTLGVNKKVSIADGATVTLNNASINASGTWTTGDYAGLTCVGDATILLADGSTNNIKGFAITGDKGYPGIYVPEGNTLTIDKPVSGSGTGILNVSSNTNQYNYGSAGIGGNYSGSCGDIVINNGVINANGYSGAGIGSARKGDCGNITINGGTVTATGKSGAGIGCGIDGNCSSITINNGTVNATGGGQSSGIGAGTGSTVLSYCGSILITGGTVIATGNQNGSNGGAGIGCGHGSEYGSECAGITITGGNVTATAAYGAAGIGTGTRAQSSGRCGVNICGNISISGGSVTATGGTDGAGIGCGQGVQPGGTSGTLYPTECGTITILNTVTKVTAIRGNTYNNIIKCIGTVKKSTCGTVTIGSSTGVVSPNQSDGKTYIYQP